MFGTFQTPISLESKSTAKGAFRRLAQFKNGFVYFEEFKRAVSMDIVAMLKNISDRLGRTTAAYSNDNRTKSSQVFSPAIIGGQDLPLQDPALTSRVIICQFLKTTFTNEEKEAFNKLEIARIDGMAHITNELVSFRDEIANRFPAQWREIVQHHQSAYTDCDARAINLFAIPLAVCYILKDFLKFPFEILGGENSLESILYKAMKFQVQAISAANEGKQFFDIIAYLISTRQLIEGEDYDFDSTQTHFALKLVKAHPLYLGEIRRQTNTIGADKNQLIEYMKAEDFYLEYKASYRFSGGSVTSCHVFLVQILQSKYSVDLVGSRPRHPSDYHQNQQSHAG
jgi:DNA primase